MHRREDTPSAPPNDMLITTATIVFLLVASGLAALAVHEMLGSGRKGRDGVGSAEIERVQGDVQGLETFSGELASYQQQFATSVEQRFVAITKEGAQHEAAIAAVFEESRNGDAELRSELEQLRMVVAGLTARVDSAHPSEERFQAIERSLQSQDMRLCTLEESMGDMVQSLAPDNNDLKRIKGIGTTLEKTLNDLGIQTIEQVANLTVDEIEVLSIELGAFAKRIERDHWVDQAKALIA